MNIMIQDTNEPKELVIRNREGIDWTNDLIGNAGGIVSDGRGIYHPNRFSYDANNDVYITDQVTFDWWAKYIADSEATDSEIQTLADKHNLTYADVTEQLDLRYNEDYEQHRKIAIRTINEWKVRQSKIDAVMQCFDALKRGVVQPTIVEEAEDTYTYIPAAYLTDASYTGSRAVVVVFYDLADFFGSYFDVNRATEEDARAVATWAADEWDWFPVETE